MALVTALAVAGALLVPLGGVAQAATLTKLDVNKEDQDVAVGVSGAKATLTATLRDEAGREFRATAATVVNFEVDGANDPGPAGTADGFSPETPDRSCTIAVGGTKCRRSYTGDVVSAVPDLVYGWISTTTLDAGEGRDDRAQPGAPEPDFTDVVARRFFQAVEGTLDCDPDTSSAQPGQPSTQITCTAPAAPNGTLIDAENMGGANDDDNGVRTNKIADYDDDCIIQGGSCQTTISGAEGQSGSADICFWIDEEDDNSFHPTLVPERDGGLCDEEPVRASEADNHTDKVTVGWGTARSVGILSPLATIRFGSRFTLRGTVSSSVDACKNNQTVVIQRDLLGGAIRYATWGSTTTNASGSYAITRRADNGANYRARLADDGDCLEALSGSKRVRVAKTVAIGASDRNVRRGQIVRISGTVKPCAGHAGDRVVLLKRRGRAFRRVGSATTNGRCRATFVRRVNTTTAFKIRAAKTDADHEAGLSRAVTIRAR